MIGFEQELEEQLEMIKEKIISSVNDNDPSYLDDGWLGEDVDELERIYSTKLEEVEE